MKEKFKQFLRDNSAYDSFMKNYNNISSFDYVFNDYEGDIYLSGSFTWTETKEGYGYWEDLENRWLSYMLM